MYNSASGSNPEDLETTMIDPALLYRSNDGPIGTSVVRHIQQANQSRSIIHSSNHDNRHDFVYVEHDRSEVAEQIEQILDFYRQDLKQQSKSQLDCDQQLITRLVDFIRPVYSSNPTKMQDLENLYEEIAHHQDIRFIEQKEKAEQLTNEMVHLKKLVSTPMDENPMRKIYQLNSMIHYDQWVEMEQESKKLHYLVETQRNKINELIELLFQEDEPSTNNQQHAVSTDQHQPSGTVHKTEERVPIAPPQPIRQFSSDTGRCPICKYVFPNGIDEDELDEHVDKCLAESRRPPDPDAYKCPDCKMQLPHNDQIYIQHVAGCHAEPINNF